jgi:hypothetical protein
VLFNLRLLDGPFERTGEYAVVQMVSAELSGSWISAAPSRWKNELPGKFTIGVGIFSRQSAGQVNLSEPFCQILLVQLAGCFNLCPQSVDNDFRQNGNAVLFSFTVADHDLLQLKRDILHPQAQAIHQTQSRTVQQLANQQLAAAQLL